MGYSVQETLRNNIRAIEIALNEDPLYIPAGEDLQVLRDYKGFGGIKAVLYPPTTKEAWTESGATDLDLKCFDDIKRLHALLQHSLPVTTEYEQVVQSLKESVLTAFYTPMFIPQVIYEVLEAQQIKLYSILEPSAGNGAFITSSNAVRSHEAACAAIEKDFLSAEILQTLTAAMGLNIMVYNKGFEATTNEDNGSYDLVISNIPFGNFKVYDPSFKDNTITDRIHNYFFAKGLEKLREGGLMAYVTTDAFLNTPSNYPIRKYLFERSDLISVVALPDNLMKDTGNTEAPTHLLIVQKNSGKQDLTEAEQLLLETIRVASDSGGFYVNQFLEENKETLFLGDEKTIDKNQYGKPHYALWQNGPIESCGEKLKELLLQDFGKNFNQRLYEQPAIDDRRISSEPGRFFTLKDMPAIKQAATNVQLGLFDIGVAEQVNRAQAYLTDSDQKQVQINSAHTLAIIQSEETKQHELVVLVTAKMFGSNRFQYKLYSNVAELQFPLKWLNADALDYELKLLHEQLQVFSHHYVFEGDQTLAASFIPRGEDTKIFTALQPTHQPGCMVIYKGSPIILTEINARRTEATFTPVGDHDKNFYGAYVRMRDLYLELFEKESSTAQSYQSLRSQLNNAYETFTGAFGRLNTPDNRRLIVKDAAYGAMMLSSIEKRVEGGFEKADILSYSLNQKQALHTDDPVEALAISLSEKGGVDLDYISRITMLSVEHITHQLDEYIFFNPQINAWETKDAYLSGNVVRKLDYINDALNAAPTDPLLLKNKTALESVQPEKIPFALLDFNLGERWIPADYYSRHATGLFETETTVHHIRSVDSFKVVVGKNNAKVTEEYVVHTKDGDTTYGNILLEYALENTTPFYTYKVKSGDKEIRLPDNDAIQLAHQKIESIRSAFIKWLEDLPQEDKQQLEKIYNDTFNCYVLREYNGGHLSFPDLQLKNLGIDDLYSSQKNAVWRILQNRGALIDHEVGLGKTLTMVVASYEMKRLGIVQKPMILALKANVDDIRQAYKKAYPHARLLAPGKEDFTPAQRKRIFYEIQNNNWDCIILTHDQFGKIPQSPAIQEKIFSTELQNVERDLETVKNTGGELSKKMLKGLEIRKKNLHAKLKEIRDAIEKRQDTDVHFQSMGIDHLFVDESHKFKNLTYTTRHNRVAGLGNQEGSMKALNMLFAVRTLQERFDADLCVTFLSGTPISNSLTEMYLLFKYLRPKEMQRQCVENFDGWAAVFAKKTTDFEFSVTNEIIAKERFRHFIKVPELAMFYNEITDYKTAAHINLDKPSVDEVLVNIKPSEDQRSFIQKLMEFARTGDGGLIGRGPLSKEEDNARMLIATNCAKKMAVDMRLLDEHRYSDDPGNKVNECARKIATHYRETMGHKGTQIVFCDIGTPKPGAFNVYNALKAKLVADFQIPAHEISFIHDWNDNNRPTLFKKMNQGIIRLLVGSTDKAGTALNVQERMIAMHHLDVPWKPSELEQRNGRGARKGNWLAKLLGNKVKSYIYAVEQSLDNYKFNLLKNKQTFISQMKNCELNVRTIDEGSIDEKSGMNFAEYIAILSGDTKLLEKSKLDKKIAVLENLRSVHFRELNRTTCKLERMARERAHTLETLDKLSIDERHYKSVLEYTKEGSKFNPIKLNGLHTADAETIGRDIIAVFKNWQPRSNMKSETIGELYGFELKIEASWDTNKLYAESPQTGIKYTFNGGAPNIDNPVYSVRYFLNAIDRVSALVEQYKKELADVDRDIPALQLLLDRPFEKEAELAQMKTEKANLEREITISIQKQQLAAGGLQQDAANPKNSKDSAPALKEENECASIDINPGKSAVMPAIIESARPSLSRGFR